MNYWKQEEVFKKLSQRQGLGSFVLHDGPPYANGDIHMGHALNKVVKDFILRYKAFRGYQINYIPGWDTHGLPIEHKVEQNRKYENLDTLKKRDLCRRYALEQLNKQKQQFQTLNLLSDFENKYKTMDQSFIEFELKLFHNLLVEKLIYWDLKPVAWSWTLQTALAESEIIYKEVETNSIYIWFPISKDHTINGTTIKKGTRMLIWTTTPYTLEGNSASIVHPDLVYVVGEDDQGNEYMVLEEAVERLSLSIKIFSKFRGKDLRGITYLNPLTGEVNRIINADYISKTSGTGIVHAAPGYGLEDYEACQREKITTYVSINKDGYFIKNSKFKPVDGLFFSEGSKIIVAWLKEKGYLYREEMITHNVGHDWRAEKPLMYIASPQWFLNLEPLLPKLKQELQKIQNTHPAWLGGKLKEMISNRTSWCLSRQRYWGVPIPILFDENNAPILDEQQVKYSIEILISEGVDVWFQKEPKYFLCPEFKKKYEGKKIKKSQDILDVWFDSGCSWGILDKNIPADLYLEGFDQLRGWFNSSSIISVSFAKKLPFKSIIGHGFILDKNGNKMSKSKGNVISPLDLIKKYGSDVVRLWIGLNNFYEDIKISEESMEHAVRLYRKIRNTIFRYSLSLIGENFQVDCSVIDNLQIPENIYIYQTFVNVWEKIEENLEKHQFFKALKLSADFINLYSGWYLEICKDVLYCGDSSSHEHREIINIVGEVFEKFLFFFGIFIPQTTEEAWQHHRPQEGTIFLNKWPKLQNKRYEIKEDWIGFWKLKDELYILIEALKNEKIVPGSSAITAVIPKNRLIENLDLIKLLNIGEILEGEELKVQKCELNICERCRRHNEFISSELCLRCEEVVLKIHGGQ